MTSKLFLDNYFSDFQSVISEFLKEDKNKNALEDAITLINSSNNKNKIFIIGNGGSASVAEHIAIDLTKNAGLNAVSFSSASTVTTFANDFGYKKWLKKALEIYSNPKDLLILVSCSGNSMNLVNANLFAKKSGLKVVTLTGCKKNNKLNNSKNDLNIWINSNKYNVIEIIHHTILLNLIDSIIEDQNF